MTCAGAPVPLLYREAVSAPTGDVIEIGPEEADHLTRGGALLLDVREDDEWAAGHAPAAAHLAMALVPERTADLPTDRTILCLCRMGGRSGSVALHLASAGFDVRNVAGGMQAWMACGLPVVAEGGTAGRVL